MTRSTGAEDALARLLRSLDEGDVPLMTTWTFQEDVEDGDVGEKEEEKASEEEKEEEEEELQSVLACLGEQATAHGHIEALYSVLRAMGDAKMPLSA